MRNVRILRRLLGAPRALNAFGTCRTNSPFIARSLGPVQVRCYIIQDAQNDELSNSDAREKDASLDANAAAYVNSADDADPAAPQPDDSPEETPTNTSSGIIRRPIIEQGVRNHVTGKRPRFERHGSPEAFIEVMRHVPRPVTIVTSTFFPPIPSQSPSDISESPEGKTSGGLDIGPILRGMTVSSFSSLRAGVRPQVIFSISLPSATYEAIKSSRRFNVAIMKPTSQGAEIAKLFVRRTPRSTSKGPRHVDEGILAYVQELSRLKCDLGGDGFANRHWEKMVEDAKIGLEVDHTRPKGTVNSSPLLSGDHVMSTVRCTLSSQVHGSMVGRQPGTPGVIGMENVAVIIGDVVDCLVSNEGSRTTTDETAMLYAHKKYMMADSKRLVPGGYRIMRLPVKRQ